MIWVSGCGGGTGGSGGTVGGVGGDGGAGSPCAFRVPLSVLPNKFIGIYVGRAGTSGGVGSLGEADSATTIQARTSYIGGDAIISPLVSPECPYFSFGYGARGSTAGTSRGGFTGLQSQTMTGTSRVTNAPASAGDIPWEFPFTGAHFPIAMFPPFGNATGGGTGGGVNPSTYGRAGIDTLNGNGYGPVSASDVTNASGGGGSGGLFGKGGAGGVVGVDSGNGGNATGYRAGGGGGAGNSAGGEATGGLVIFEY